MILLYIYIINKPKEYPQQQGSSAIFGLSCPSPRVTITHFDDFFLVYQVPANGPVSFDSATRKWKIGDQIARPENGVFENEVDPPRGNSWEHDDKSLGFGVFHFRQTQMQVEWQGCLQATMKFTSVLPLHIGQFGVLLATCRNLRMYGNSSLFLMCPSKSFQEWAMPWQYRWHLSF